MKVTVENKKGLQKDLKVFIDKKTISGYLEDKYEEIRKDVVLKGFRPGKVPTEILKRQFGKAVYGEVIDKVLKDSTTKALEENKIKPAGQPKIDLKSFGEGKDLEYTISVTELPKIDVSSVSKIKVDEYEVKIDAKETDKRIEQIAKNQNAQTEELLHNLTTLNTYSIHDLFSLIPQDALAKNINTQKEIVKNILIEKPNVSASTLLQLIKYNLALKVEFSVFEKTLKEYPLVQKMEDSIRNVILSILQIFITDFNDKNITVSLDSSEKRLQLDYDSFSVSLYYIFDNAVKYCSRNTHFKIILKEFPDCFSVLFDMLSIRIEDDEIEKLYMKNYRSEIAKKMNAKGSGIGMFRILKTLKLNDAELIIKPRVTNYTRKANSTIYEHNQFIINFKGKQDWFKHK